ncbi:sulfatase domain protein [Verrucomicrobiia bacterium DG1235]|nr:sulfatase domain protein [Verrucomicrobiae bacterium DG1235]
MKKIALALLALLANTVFAERPNILWISSEDHGPHLGSYGDTYATTPQLDAFAQNSLRYTKASSNAPVCAPARTTIISGMYPTSLGAHHMRSRAPSPHYLKFFPIYLQEAGYYTTNNSKEDYNLETENKGWNESSNTAHWKNRPDPNQPFFSVFNFFGTHESQIRNENKKPQHDPALAPIPPYHPDTPEVRKDWAQYYDRLSLLDTFFQTRIDELEEAGLADDTIVIFWSDHGSGMPRSKRYPGWSGQHVALIVHIPEKFRNLAPADYAPGAATDRLVSFVDFAPTTLSLAGITPPDYYHGHAFLGKRIAPAPSHTIGFKGRMDERPDECRSVTDGRFVYIRNYLPHLPHGQYLDYQQQTETTRLWYQLFKDKKLTPIQSAFWQPHPSEELFDLQTDPYETQNLASDPAHRETLASLSQALDTHQIQTRDLGFLPEPLLRKAILQGESPATVYASRFNPNQALATPPNLSVSKYWRFATLLSSSPEAIRDALPAAIAATNDDEPIVAVAAAELVTLHTQDDSTRTQALDTLIALAKFPENELILTLHALNALGHAHEAGIKLPSTINQLATEHPDIPDWASSYRPSLLTPLQTP